MDFNELLDYTKSIDLTKADGDTLHISDKADQVLDQLLEVERFVADAKDKLKERFLQIAQKNTKLKSYEGDHVVVGYRMARRKKITGTPEQKFVIIEKKPNSKVIDNYREATGKLPDGIGEETFEYINFKLVASKEEVDNEAN
jgi:hypothetical protein